ncbi:CHAT domain-containing protein [Microbacterium lacus]|uniref:CHAT domain-containing protein n=1 Tax=Microbacterium lacus TaxID=415217 RepID=UPI00384F14E2
MTLSAAELYRRGRAHLNAGQTAAARRVLSLAAARTEDTDLRALIAGSTAAAIIRQGDVASAERICREALELPGVSRHTAAVLHGQLGLLALERGDLDDSIAWLDRAIAGIGDDVEHRAPMYLNRSVAHMQAGRLAEGRADLDRAVPDYAATGNEIERAMTVHNAGYASLLAGDLVSALGQMGEAYLTLASASAVNAAICELDRAEVLRDAGMATDAERSLERVTQVFGAHRMSQAKGEAEFHLARSLLTHLPEKAVQAASRSARTFRRVRSDWWALRADAVRMRAQLMVAAAQADGKSRPAPSREAINDLAAELERRRLRADASSLRFTWLLHGARHADALSQRSVVRIAKDAPIQVRLLAHEVRATRAAALGDHARARHHASEGLEALAQWQASFGSLDLASSLVQHGAGLIFAGLGAAVRSSRPEVLFDWSERARHLSVQTIPLRPPPDADLASDLAELRMLRAEYGSGDWLSAPRAAELSDSVRARQWSAVAAVGASRRIGLAELHATLADDTAYVTFVFDRSDMFALTVAGGEARITTVARWPAVAESLAGLRADLDMSAAIRTGPMAPAVTRALQGRLAALSAALIEPLLPMIGDRRVVLTIPGILGGLPWAMLPALRGRIFTVATSASQWCDRRISTRPRRVGFAVGPRVTRGNEEVLRASAAWPSAEILLGGAATVSALTGLSERSDVLHLAAHGRHSHDHPLFSGVELTDGTLFGYDIDLIPNVPDIVVMSACEVGRSTARGGEEAIGMTRIWLHAGTRCVIAAPVVVADDVACELLGEMHQGLAAGLAPAVALAEASDRTGIVAPFQAHGSGF